MTDTSTGAVWLRYPFGALIIGIGLRCLWVEATPPIHPWHFALFVGVIVLGGGIMVPDPVFGAMARGFGILGKTGIPFVGQGKAPTDPPAPPSAGNGP